MRKRLLPLLILSLLPVPALAEPPSCPLREFRVLAPDGTERVRYNQQRESPVLQCGDESDRRSRDLLPALS